MTSNRNPFTGSGRYKEGGELATRKQDFNAHIQGNGYRHTADQLDMNPVISSLGSGTTVQETLEAFSALLTSNGTGFISIGDANGTSSGVYNMNTVDTPTLKDAFNAAFADARLAGGGVVLVLAGTYVLTSTVEVPPGISIMGEVGGTLIIGEMNEQSMFTIGRVEQELDVNGNSGSGDIDLDISSNVDKVRFSNLMLADNLNGMVASGNSSMLTVPMVAIQNACNFECNNVTFIGRVNDGTLANRGKTKYAISNVTGGSTGTTLSLNECFFDGLKVAVNFAPALGNLDYLTITKCKFRTFGTEGAASVVLNSCISASVCNMNITNNYYIGAGTITNTFLNVISSGGTTSTCKGVVCNISGAPSTASLGHLIKNDSGITLNLVVTGNNWGNETNSPWYIVVGGSSATSPLGDIFGPDAIDIILTMSTNSYQGTVIVNPGTYTVNGNLAADNYTNLKFIGNKHGKSYPVFNLDIGAVTTDSVGNKFIVFGNHIESIQFNSVNSFQSIRPSFNAISNTLQTAANTMVVRDCIFTNTSLNALDVGAGPFVDSLGNTSKLRILVEECNFSQTGAFADNVSLLLPPSHIVHVRDCNFSGNGYAANIGTATYTGSFGDAHYILENITFDLSSGTISASAPGTPTDSYIYIQDQFGKVTMNNCQVLCSTSLGAATGKISGALATTFTSFIFITPKSLDIENCVFNGPVQTFSASSVLYPMPTVRVDSPRESVRVKNSKFINGGLPLQISGIGAFLNLTQADGIFIENNTFINSNLTITECLLDIDVDLAANQIQGGTVIVDGNVFKTLATGTVYQVRHTEQTDTFTALGIVNIYCPWFDVRVSNNKIYGQLEATVVNPYNHFAGIVVNTWNTTSGTDGNSLTSVNINNNRIDVINSFSGSASTQSSVCCWVRSPAIFIHDNYLGMNNSAGASITNFAGCLYLEGRQTVTGTFSDSIVSGNIFSRRSITGQAVGLSNGYIYIPSTSTARGMIVDNSFSDDTFDGLDEDLLSDNTAVPNKWTFERNKNQVVTTKIYGVTGTWTYDTTDGTTLLNDLSATNAVLVLYNDAFSNTNAIITNNGTSVDIRVVWRVNLGDVLPSNVFITNVEIVWKFSSGSPPVSGTDDIILSLSGRGPTTLTDTDTMHGASVGVPTTLQVVPGNTSAATLFKTDETIHPVAQVMLKYNASTTFNFDLSGLEVTYKW